MSLVLAAVLSVTGPVLPSCSWDRPGANSFQGDVVAAVDRYQDIPVATREALKKRMTARKYDEIATIRRDSIEGSNRYTDLRDMHFGKGTICRSVTRSKWTPTTTERGLVYCEDGHCLIVPTVCRNVSRVTRSPVQQKAEALGPGGGTNDPALASVADVPPGNGELQFEAPAAGARPAFAAAGLPGGSDVGVLGGGAEGPVTPGGGAPSWVAPSLPFVVASTPGGGGTPTVPNVPGVPGGVTNPTVPGVPSVPGTPGVTTPVPEPSTWAMLAVGLGVLAFVGRRRGKSLRSLV